MAEAFQAMMFQCESADGTLVGVAQIDNSTDEILITLRPVASLSGILLDMKTNQRLAEQRLPSQTISTTTAKAA